METSAAVAEVVLRCVHVIKTEKIKLNENKEDHFFLIFI